MSGIAKFENLEKLIIEIRGEKDKKNQ